MSGRGGAGGPTAGKARRVEAVIRAATAHAAGTHGLTRRESDVIRCVLRGLDTRAIASELGCGTKTVETHVTSLLRKTGTSGRLELAARAWLAWALATQG